MAMTGAGRDVTDRSSYRWRRRLGALAGVALAGCSSGSADVGSASRPGPSTRAAPSTRPAAPSTIDAQPARTATFDQLQQAVVDIANPDGIVALAGSLWVKTDDGRAVRLDPATNRVTAQVRLDHVSDPRTYCQGIGSDGTRVWACAAEDRGTALAQIDAAGARVVRRVRLDKHFDQLALPATARGMWSLTGDGSVVRVVDPASGHSTAYPLGVACHQLAAAGNRVVATASAANLVVVLDAASGTVVGRVHLSGPRIAALLDGEVWVDTDDGLTRLGPDLHVRSRYPHVVAGLGGDVLAAVGSIWVRASDGPITRIDPATGQVVERITVARQLSGGSLYVAFGSIWTTANDEGVLIRLRRDR